MIEVFLYESEIENARLIITFKGRMSKVYIDHIITILDMSLLLVVMQWQFVISFKLTVQIKLGFE